MADGVREKKDFDGCGDNSQGWLIECVCMDEGLSSVLYQECGRSVVDVFCGKLNDLIKAVEVV